MQLLGSIPWIFVLPAVFLLLGLVVLLLLFLSSHRRRGELQHEATSLTAQLRAESEARIRFEERSLQVPVLQEALKEREGSIQRLEQKVLELSSARAELHTRLEEEREQFAEKLKLLTDTQEQLQIAFRALSAEALQSNSQQFFEMAKQTLGQFQESNSKELELRREAIGQLVQPMQESLLKFDQKLQDLEVKRISAYEGLRQQVDLLHGTQKALQSETANLVRALRAPQVRGRWGEVQLRRVVELAGMVEHCDFQEQVQVDSGEAKFRPDLIVYLPGGKTIVVDAKAPLQAYLDSVQAENDAQRQGFLIDHARQLRAHVDSLASKSYWKNFQQTPEFVVLFIPGEVFYSAALEKEPSLLEFGAESRVLIATPTTLIALLRAVAYGWRQEALAKNASEISRLGKEMFERLASMTKHFADTGNSLRKATETYNKAVGAFESRVLVSARRFQELEAADPEQVIPTLEPVELTTRELELKNV